MSFILSKRLLIILLLLTTVCYGQQKKKKSTTKKKTSHPITFEFYYGNTVFNKNFYNQLNTFNSFNPHRPLQQVGIGMRDYHTSFTPRIRANCEYGLSFYIPNKVTFNDTLVATLSGFCWNMGFGKAILKNAKIFRLNVYAGFNTGRTRITGDDNLRLKNPYFAPKVTLVPKLTIKRICVSLMLNYAYDLSNQ